MYSHEEEFNWFIYTVTPIATPRFKLKTVSGKGDFGDLLGVQLESNSMSGYVYFWRNNVIGFELSDLITEEQIIEDSLIMVENLCVRKVLGPLIDKLRLTKAQ